MADENQLAGGERQRRIFAQAEELKRRFEGLGLTLATAESCTGGGLASAITDVPGSSVFFLGGIVAYSNPVKERLLGVDPELLSEHGAVSDPVALAMAGGARYALRADVGVGITGIAGPDGGSEGKPVGTVHIAIVSPMQRRVERYVWSEDRTGNKTRSVEAALAMLLAYTEGPLP